MNLASSGAAGFSPDPVAPDARDPMIWHMPCIRMAMPFNSQAQRRKFAQLLVEGKISNETFEEWNKETGSASLPERVKRKAKKKQRKSRKTSKRKKAPARGRKRRSAKR